MELRHRILRLRAPEAKRRKRRPRLRPRSIQGDPLVPHAGRLDPEIRSQRAQSRPGAARPCRPSPLRADRRPPARAGRQGPSDAAKGPAPHPRRRLLAQGHLSPSAMAGRDLHVRALLRPLRRALRRQRRAGGRRGADPGRRPASLRSKERTLLSCVGCQPAAALGRS